MIAPHFEKLAGRLASSSKVKSDATRPNVAFCKVNVDQVQSVARECKIHAMPTFLAYRSGKLHDVVQGANPSGLTAMIENAVKPGPVEPTESALKFAEGKSPSAFGSLSSLFPFLIMLLFWYFSRK